MVYDTNVSVQAFLDAAAARQPTPGGGSIAALTGALAASMAEMAVNYSVGKKGLEQFQSELVPALEQFHAARSAFERLVVEDQKAYEEMTAARKVKDADPARWERAVRAGVTVPAEVVSVAAGVLELCDNVVNFVNPRLLSDLSVAADLAMVTVRCGIYNARVNLPDLRSDTDRIAAEASINEAVTRAVKVVQRVTPRIWERVALES
jgi:formiminotetrahydrofolate cyclodeaminase